MISRIDELETSEQFNDCYKQFLLYYGKDLPDMHEHMKAKNKERQNTVRTTKVVKVSHYFLYESIFSCLLYFIIVCIKFFLFLFSPAGSWTLCLAEEKKNDTLYFTWIFLVDTHNIL